MVRKQEANMANAIKAGRKVGRRSGYIKATFSIEPEQLAAVVSEARRRADTEGAIRADASAVVREALAAWIARRKG